MKLLPTQLRKNNVTLVILLLGGASLLAVALLPSGGGNSVSVERSNVRVMEAQIVAAIQNFTAEYGHPPGNRPDGRYEDPAGNAQIFAVLRAMDARQNPRQIVYFEAKNARLRSQRWLGPKKLSDGFDPNTGALLDPYGNSYRVRVWPESSPKIGSPYKDVPSSWMIPIVWSVGSDGQPGCAGDSEKFQGSDDILSLR